MATTTTTKQKSGSVNSKAELQFSELHPAEDLLEYAKAFAKERPEIVALWCLGAGFILGWKLKPW